MNRTLHVIFNNSNPAAICRQGMEFKKNDYLLNGRCIFGDTPFFN